MSSANPSETRVAWARTTAMKPRRKAQLDATSIPSQRAVQAKRRQRAKTRAQQIAETFKLYRRQLSHFGCWRFNGAFIPETDDGRLLLTALLHCRYSDDAAREAAPWLNADELASLQRKANSPCRPFSHESIHLHAGRGIVPSPLAGLAGEGRRHKRVSRASSTRYGGGVRGAASTTVPEKSAPHPTLPRARSRL